MKQFILSALVSTVVFSFVLSPVFAQNQNVPATGSTNSKTSTSPICNFFSFIPGCTNSFNSSSKELEAQINSQKNLVQQTQTELNSLKLKTNPVVQGLCGFFSFVSSCQESIQYHKNPNEAKIKADALNLQIVQAQQLLQKQNELVNQINSNKVDPNYIQYQLQQLQQQQQYQQTIIQQQIQNQYLNPMTNPNINPLLNPQINPMLNPQINPMANPNINPMANPNINPMVNPQINPMVNPQINPYVNPQINPYIPGR